MPLGHRFPEAYKSVRPDPFCYSAREFLDKLKKDVGGLTQKKIDEILLAYNR